MSRIDDYQSYYKENTPFINPVLLEIDSFNIWVYECSIFSMVRFTNILKQNHVTTVDKS